MANAHERVDGILSDGESQERTLSEEEAHDILRNGRRRNTIDYLRQNGEEVQVRELAEHIAEREAETTPAPRNIRNSVYVALHQTHLPKLDDHRVVDYDTTGKEVTLKKGVEALEPYLEDDDDDPPWSVFYLGYAVIAAVIMVSSLLDVPVISVFDPIVWTTGFLLVTAGLLTFELARRRERWTFDDVRSFLTRD